MLSVKIVEDYKDGFHDRFISVSNNSSDPGPQQIGVGIGVGLKALGEKFNEDTIVCRLSHDDVSDVKWSDAGPGFVTVCQEHP